MKWKAEDEAAQRMVIKAEDEAAQRMVIVQLYGTIAGNQKFLANLFQIHINSVSKYISNYTRNGSAGLFPKASGPKDKWKITPQVRAKILLIVLKMGVRDYEGISKKLKNWNEDVSQGSIHQVLSENGLANTSISLSSENTGQIGLFENRKEECCMKFNFTKKTEVTDLEKGNNQKRQHIKEEEPEIDLSLLNEDNKSRHEYSLAQRKYLDRLEEGEYNTYAGGLLFVPLLKRYNYLPAIEKVLKIEPHKGYDLSELCLALFYFDIFGFCSIENFKTGYPDEYGILLGKSCSPSIRTLRRFLHKVRNHGKGEELIEEFGKEYLKNGLVKWGVLYIDAHFLPYYGYMVISMGWHSVRSRALKGSYNFITNDEEFNPLLFLVRASSEDLLEKIPEIINKSKRVVREAGIDSSDLTVIFDRKGYSAELFRRLDGKEGEGPEWEGEDKVKFITWAKYADKWVNDFKEDQFTKKVNIKYKIRKKKLIKYFEIERSMSKYEKIRAIVIENGPDERRTAIYTNDRESDAGRIIQLISKRWGQENLIKALKLRHLLDYFPGYVFEELAEQPMVDNPKKEELKREKARLTSQLHKLELKLAEKIINESMSQKKILV